VASARKTEAQEVVLALWYGVLDRFDYRDWDRGFGYSYWESGALGWLARKCGI